MKLTFGKNKCLSKIWQFSYKHRLRVHLVSMITSGLPTIYLQSGKRFAKSNRPEKLFTQPYLYLFLLPPYYYFPLFLCVFLPFESPSPSRLFVFSSLSLSPTSSTLLHSLSLYLSSSISFFALSLSFSPFTITLSLPISPSLSLFSVIS